MRTHPWLIRWLEYALFVLAVLFAVESAAMRI